MGETHSKPLAARGGMAGERHAMCESAFNGRRRWAMWCVVGIVLWR